MLAEGWQIKNLDAVAQIQFGATVNSNQVLQDPLAMPYMRVANVQDGWLDLQEIEEISIERAHLERYCLQYGDVLLALGGDADKVGRAEIWRAQIALCLHQNHVLAIRAQRQHLLPEYLNALIGSSYGKTYFRRCANQSTNLASLNASLVREFPLLLPPIAEQEKIMQMLGDFDQAIDCVERAIRNSQTQKHGWMQKIFSEQYSFTGSPANWRSAQLGDLATLADSALGTQVAEDFRFRYIEISDVRGGFIADELAEYCKANAPARARRMVQAGDVLLAMVRPNLKRYARALAKHDGCVATSGFAVLRPKAEISTDFLYYSLYSDMMQLQFKISEKGSNYPQLNLEDVKNLELRYPNRAEQESICNLLGLLDQRIQLEQRSLQTLRQQRAEMFERVLQRVSGL